MSKKPKTKLRKPRNPYALEAKKRKAGPMKTKKQRPQKYPHEHDFIEQVHAGDFFPDDDNYEFCIECNRRHYPSDCYPR